jgi:glycosyltransferase involved in cell wall biosynthesis
MTDDRVSISVVICTRNRDDLIGQAVGSVLSCEHPSFELFVIDQSDSDATERALDAVRDDPRLHYVHTDRVGLSSAYNIGIELADGELLAFTDDDCMAPSDWLTSVERAFEAHPDVELLYGQVLLPEALRDADGEVPTLRIGERQIVTAKDGFEIRGMGANYAARASLFRRIGGFDEVLGGGGALRSSQDFDLQYRLYRAGGACLLEPDVRIDHYGLRTKTQWPATLLAYGVGDGAFYMKHARCRDTRALRLIGSKLAREATRAPWRVATRRSEQVNYLRGFVMGMIGSFRFSVDRRRRMYGGQA